MCIICTEWEKGKLTDKEAMAAVGEMIANAEDGADHYFELANKIVEKSVPPDNIDEEMDESWWRETHEDN